MQEERKIIGGILAKYPEITPEEQLTLNKWLENTGNEKIFNAIVPNETRVADLEAFLEFRSRKEIVRQQYYDHISEVKRDSSSTKERKRVGWISTWKGYVIAASVILLLGFVAYKLLLVNDKRFVKETPNIAKVDDVKPGKFSAKLTLDDGKTTIILDSVSNGTLVQQDGISVLHKDGKLIYEKNGETKKALYNTLSTDKGETYPVVLSDGTQVWLNSLSSIRFPVSFNGDIRQVEVTGEVYFEVTPSVARLANGEKGKRPFIVSAPDMDVEVLGTHFNINSYGDEASVETTLLEGKVKIRSKSNEAVAILQPGQQASLDKQTKQLKKQSDIDVDEAVAWHFGFFQFGGADLQTVLRQLSRWYDVDVIYQGSVPQRQFAGKISRENTLSQVLGILETNNVHFKIEGKKIIVSP